MSSSWRRSTARCCIACRPPVERPNRLRRLNAERKENSHRWPHFLPDGRHFLFTARSDVKENNLVYVGSLDSKDVTRLVAAQSNAVYVGAGYLLFARDGSLMAQRFDPATLSLSGEPVPVVAASAHHAELVGGVSALQPTAPVLATARLAIAPSRMIWFDRAGRPRAAIGPERVYSEVRLAPNAEAGDRRDPGSRQRQPRHLAARSHDGKSHPPDDESGERLAGGLGTGQPRDRVRLGSQRTIERVPETIDAVDEELLLRIPGRGAFPKDWSGMAACSRSGSTADGPAGIWALSLVGDRTPFPLVDRRPRKPGEAVRTTAA